MKKLVVLTQALFAVTLLLIFLPYHQREITDSRIPLVVVLCLIEFWFWFSWLRNRTTAKLDRQTKSIVFSIVFAVFLVWELCTSTFTLVNPVLYPGPEEVFYVYVDYWRLILLGVVLSLTKLLVGIGLALVLGTLIGLFIGWVPGLRKVFFPICKVLSPIPPVVYVSYVIAILPTFASASIAVVFLGVFWPTLLSTIVSISNIDQKIITSAKSMGVNHMTMIFRVILPYTLPVILGSLTMMVSFSFMTLTSAEMIGSTAGLGFFVQKYASYAIYSNVICGIITIGVVVVLLNRGVDWLKHALVKWK